MEEAIAALKTELNTLQDLETAMRLLFGQSCAIHVYKHGGITISTTCEVGDDWSLIIPEDEETPEGGE